MARLPQQMPQQPTTPAQRAEFFNQPAANTATAATSAPTFAFHCKESFRSDAGLGPSDTVQGRYQPRSPPLEDDDGQMTDVGQWGGYYHGQPAQQWENNERFQPEVWC